TARFGLLDHDATIEFPQLDHNPKKQSLAGPVVGPLRVSVVPGPGGSAGDAGACAVSEPLACRAVGSKLRCE
ncbi:MAG: hypothetical protein ACKOCT_10515, partial [Alphaproteobacteria bacterium]